MRSKPQDPTQLPFSRSTLAEAGGTCTDSTSLLRPGPIPEPPLRYVHGESTILTLGSLPKGGMENSTERLLMHFAGKRLSAVESDVLSINTSTRLRLIIPDQSREFDQDTTSGVAARDQLLAGLAAATIAAEPAVSLISVQYSSSYSTLPATHVVGNQSVDVSYDWIDAGGAEPIPVGIEDGSIPVTIPDSAFWPLQGSGCRRAMRRTTFRSSRG